MRREPAPGEKGPLRFPPPAIFVAGLLLAIGAESLWPTDDLPLSIAIPVAVILGAIAVYLDGRASANFMKHKTAIIPWSPSSELVTDGPYRLTRNPMYLGMAFLYLAIAVGFGLYWALLLLPLVIVAVDRLVIMKEERYLTEKFGDAYRSYKAEVRRWL